MSELIIIWLVVLSTYLMILCLENMYKEELLPQMNWWETILTLIFGFAFSPFYLAAALISRLVGRK